MAMMSSMTAQVKPVWLTAILNEAAMCRAAAVLWSGRDAYSVHQDCVVHDFFKEQLSSRGWLCS